MNRSLDVDHLYQKSQSILEPLLNSKERVSFHKWIQDGYRKALDKQIKLKEKLKWEQSDHTTYELPFMNWFVEK